MKRYLWLMLMGGMLVAAPLQAQLKADDEASTNASQTLFRPTPSISSFLGLLNPDNFQMHHSVSFSYLSAGGAGTSLASYTNTMMYKIADPLQVRLDLTLQGSPFGQGNFISAGPMNKLFISNAELKYRPWDNTSIWFQYSQLPIGYYGLYPYAPYGSSPYFRGE